MKKIKREQREQLENGFLDIDQTNWLKEHGKLNFSTKPEVYFIAKNNYKLNYVGKLYKPQKDDLPAISVLDLLNIIPYKIFKRGDRNKEDPFWLTFTKLENKFAITYINSENLCWIDHDSSYLRNVLFYTITDLIKNNLI